MTKAQLENQLNEWQQKVITAYDYYTSKKCPNSFASVMIDTFAMIADVDAIIGTAFDREPVLKGDN